MVTLCFITTCSQNSCDVRSSCGANAETVDNLSAKVEEVSGVFTRHQRLIYKGKVLAKGASMAEAQLKDGSKVMLMASSSTATQVRLLCLTLYYAN